MTADAVLAPQLDRRRVYIFPSRPGLTLGVMLVIILLGAINYDNALGYLLAFLLGGLFMVAMLHTYRNLAGLRLRGAHAHPVFAGEIARFECLIDNPTARPRLRLHLKHWPQGLGRAARRYLRRFEAVFDIERDTSARVSVTVDANRRGWLALERVVIHSHYPLGILRAWGYFETDARCLVYPAPRGSRTLPSARAATGSGAAASDSGADDFAGLRPYAAGDPVRAIAWKTLAREQDLMVKRFHGQAARQLWLSWSAAGRDADPEARLSQLTAWVVEAHRSGASWGLELPGTTLALGQGPRHRDACLRALALYEHGR